MAWSVEDIPDLTGTTCVVTGGNRGIGQATVRVLAAKAATVVMACRDVNSGYAAADSIRDSQPDADITVLDLDLASLHSVQAFAKRMTADLPRLDLLINNAGVMYPPLTRTEDDFELQFGTNVLGHFALTGLLLPLVTASDRGRVIWVSSMVHRYARIDYDNLNAERGYNRVGAYNRSKLATLVLCHELERRLRATGTSAMSVAVHPGITKSDLARHSRILEKRIMPVVAQSAEDGALPSLMAATAPDIRGGDFVVPSGFFELRGAPRIQKPSRRATDTETGRRLWSAAEGLTGVRYPS